MIFRSRFRRKRPATTHSAAESLPTLQDLIVLLPAHEHQVHHNRRHRRSHSNKRNHFKAWLTGGTNGSKARACFTKHCEVASASAQAPICMRAEGHVPKKGKADGSDSDIPGPCQSCWRKALHPSVYSSSCEGKLSSDELVLDRASAA